MERLYKNQIWESQALPNETKREAAERFCVESFGGDRLVIWDSDPMFGEFRISQGYSYYRVLFRGRFWRVVRMKEEVPAKKE